MALTVMSAGAQSFIPMKKGAVLEYRYYNAKGRPLLDEWSKERWMRFTVEDVWGDSVANVVIESSQLAQFGAMNEPMKRTTTEIGYGDVSVTAEGVTFENMRWVFPQIPSMFSLYTLSERGRSHSGGWFGSDGESYYRAELSATSHLPREIHVGDKLPDEQYRALFVDVLSEAQRASREEMKEKFVEHLNSRAPTASLNIEDRASFINRRVEAFEKVSVPAGEFECWKISYELVKPEFKVLGLPDEQLVKERIISGNPPVVTKYVDYLSPEVGLVKREKMNFRGKRVEEMMVLIEIR